MAQDTDDGRATNSLKPNRDGNSDEAGFGPRAIIILERQLRFIVWRSEVTTVPMNKAEEYRANAPV
jgi:hypothetical protein